MKWFRTYSQAMHDPKILRLSDAAFRFWFNALCMANEGSPRGTIPDARDIAVVLRTKEDKVARMLDELRSCGLLDENADGTLSPHNWAERQHKSDDVTERVRKFRGKHTGPAPERSGNVSETPRGNVSETPRGNVSETPRGRADSDSDSETDSPQPPEGGAAGPTEPGDAGPRPTIPPPVRNAPADVARVEAKAAELWPVNGWGHLARSACNEAPAAWVMEAMQIGADGGADSWRFVNRVLDRFRKQGGPDSARSRPNGRDSPPPDRPAPRYPAPDPEATKRYAAIKPPGPRTDTKA